MSLTVKYDNSSQKQGCPLDFPCDTASIDPQKGKANSRDVKQPQTLSTVWTSTANNTMNIRETSLNMDNSKLPIVNNSNIMGVNVPQNNEQLRTVQNASVDHDVATITVKQAQIDKDAANADAAKLRKERDHYIEQASIAIDTQTKQVSNATATQLDQQAQNRANDAKTAGEIGDMAEAMKRAKAADVKVAAVAAVDVATAAVQKSVVVAAKGEEVQNTLQANLESSKAEQSNLEVIQFAAERDRTAAKQAYDLAIKNNGDVSSAKDKLDKANNAANDINLKLANITNNVVELQKANEGQKLVVNQQKTNVVTAVIMADATKAIKQAITDHIDATTTGVAAKHAYQDSSTKTRGVGSSDDQLPQFDDSWRVFACEKWGTCSYYRDDKLVVCKMRQDNTCPSEYNSDTCMYLKPIKLDIRSAMASASSY